MNKLILIFLIFFSNLHAQRLLLRTGKIIDCEVTDIKDNIAITESNENGTQHIPLYLFTPKARIKALEMAEKSRYQRKRIKAIENIRTKFQPISEYSDLLSLKPKEMGIRIVLLDPDESLFLRFLLRIEKDEEWRQELDQREYYIAGKNASKKLFELTENQYHTTMPAVMMLKAGRRNHVTGGIQTVDHLIKILKDLE